LLVTSYINCLFHNLIVEVVCYHWQEGGGKVIHIAIFWEYVNLNPKPSTVQILPSGMHN
jgi:hypothetical protein